jgi:hypothetical protein
VHGLSFSIIGPQNIPVPIGPRPPEVNGRRPRKVHPWACHTERLAEEPSFHDLLRSLNGGVVEEELLSTLYWCLLQGLPELALFVFQALVSISEVIKETYHGSS